MGVCGDRALALCTSVRCLMCSGRIVAGMTVEAAFAVVCCAGGGERSEEVEQEWIRWISLESSVNHICLVSTSVCLSVCLSICISVCLPICLFVFSWFVGLYLFVPSVCLSTCTGLSLYK